MSNDKLLSIVKRSDRKTVSIDPSPSWDISEENKQLRHDINVALLQIQSNIEDKLADLIHALVNQQDNLQIDINKISVSIGISNDLMKKLNNLDMSAMAEEAALKSLKSIGLADRRAIFDLDELRSFAKTMRETKSSLSKELIKLIVPTLFAILSLGLFMKFGG